MIAWYKGHHLSKQEACCFASVFISAVLKWVKEDKALSRDLINKHFASTSQPCWTACSQLAEKRSSLARSPITTAQVQWFLKRENDSQHEVLQRTNQPYSGDTLWDTAHVPQRRIPGCISGLLEDQGQFTVMSTDAGFMPGISIGLGRLTPKSWASNKPCRCGSGCGCTGALCKPSTYWWRAMGEPTSPGHLGLSSHP